MLSIAMAVKGVDRVVAGNAVVPSVVVEEAAEVGGDSAKQVSVMQGGIDGALEGMSLLSDAEKNELKSWYAFVKAHPGNPWLAQDARLQEKWTSSCSPKQSDFAKRCYHDLVEPFDFELYYALVNMALVCEEDVLGYHAYDEHDLEVPEAYRMIAGTETYCYKKPGLLWIDHVERVTVYKAGDEARLVEEGTYRAMQEIFEAHRKGEESNHWTSQYTSAFARGCPRCGAKCWLYGPCLKCFAECEQRWHITCGAATVQHKLEVEHCLMKERGIGKRARDRILQGSLAHGDRWQILGSTIHLAQALKRATTYVRVPKQLRYRLIRRFVEELVEFGKDRCCTDSAALDPSLDGAMLIIKHSGDETGGGGNGDSGTPPV